MIALVLFFEDQQTHVGHAVHEKAAIKVIEFMLKYGSRKVLQLKLLRFALHVQVVNAHVLRPFHKTALYNMDWTLTTLTAFKNIGTQKVTRVQCIFK